MRDVANMALPTNAPTAIKTNSDHQRSVPTRTMERHGCGAHRAWGNQVSASTATRAAAPSTARPTQMHANAPGLFGTCTLYATKSCVAKYMDPEAGNWTRVLVSNAVPNNAKAAYTNHSRRAFSSGEPLPLPLPDVATNNEADAVDVVDDEEDAAALFNGERSSG